MGAAGQREATGYDGSRRGPRATLIAIACLLGLGLLLPASAPAAAPTLPLPGGKYIGETGKHKSRALKVKVRGATDGATVQGFVRYRCARIKARFTSDDGTFVAKDRNARGKVVFKAKGKFKRLKKAVGEVKRLKKSRRKPGCKPADFKAKLSNQGPIKMKTISYGPFPTEPTGGHGDAHDGGGRGGHSVGRGNLEKPCTDCAIVGMLPELREADGSRGNFDTGSMLHHVVFFNGAERDATCQGWPQRWFASGNERTPRVLPRGYGYEVAPEDNWSLLTHLMNMGDEAKPLFIEMTFFYVPGATGVEAVEPFWLDVDGCGNSEYMTPAGRHTESRDFTVPASLAGKIVATGGHLHDHGEKIVLRNVSADERICKGRAAYGSDPSYEGHIESAGGCTGRPLAKVRSGQKLRLSATYDAPQALHDVMGIMMGYVAPRP